MISSFSNPDVLNFVINLSAWIYLRCRPKSRNKISAGSDTSLPSSQSLTSSSVETLPLYEVSRHLKNWMVFFLSALLLRSCIILEKSLKLKGRINFLFYYFSISLEIRLFGDIPYFFIYWTNLFKSPFDNLVSFFGSFFPWAPF